jgi:LmbE family N-acetylglucosaminyl deacetylase
MHPYRRFVSELVRLTHEARGQAQGGYPPAPRPVLAADAPRVLIFAPHPDDECLTGGLPLRLLREAHLRVIDVAVTLGSNVARREERRGELGGACAFLGFELVTAGPAGLEQIQASTRARDPARWEAAVATIAGLIERERPRALFCPHEGDLNGTHIGTHHLVMDALGKQPPSFTCAVIETEYWAPMATPNLMIESSPDDVADLVAATAFHAGEVARNPYHVTLPSWMQDNVRRGAELVGRQGGASPDFAFATLYRLRTWRGGALEPAAAGRVLPATADPAVLL